MNLEERSTLETLEATIWSSSLEDRFGEIVARLEQRLRERPGDAMAWETIPHDVFTSPLPESIRSSWIFILRANTTTGAERQPNSHQRSMSYRGSGDFQTRTDGDWQSHLLASDLEVRLEQRWLSIPRNVWHQLVVPDDNWVLISFHTVTEDELIEERPGDDTEAGVRQMKYSDHNL